MDTELLDAINDFRESYDQVTTDLYNTKELYDKWDSDQPFVDPATHWDVTIQGTVPAAGDLEEGEIRYGDGTGPNGRDEMFWSVDGNTVARVEADSVIS